MGLTENRAALTRAAEKFDAVSTMLLAAGREAEEAATAVEGVIQGFGNADLNEAAHLASEASLGISEAQMRVMGATVRLRDYIEKMS